MQVFINIQFLYYLLLQNKQKCYVITTNRSIGKNTY